MLATLDQWAFQFLIVLSSMLGVQDLPKNDDRNWTVIERWEEQPDKTYRLTLENLFNAHICRDHPGNSLVFPQTYIGRQEVYVDGIKFLSNEMSRPWVLKTSFGKHVISCRFLANANKITFISTSYLKYYASISSYPSIQKMSTIKQLFFNEIYLISGTFCLAICLIGEIILWRLRSRIDFSNFLALGLFSSLCMYCHVPGFFLEIPVNIDHTLVFVGLVGMGLSFIYPKLKYYLGGWRVYLFWLILLSATLLTLLTKDIAQAISILGVFIVVVTIAFLGIFATNFTRSERIQYIFVFLICMRDFYMSQAVRDGYLHLSFLAMVLVAVSFLRILGEINEKNAKMIEIKARLKDERFLANKIASMNELLRQVIHDLKSPITSLAFVLKSGNVNISVIGMVNKRLTEILAQTEGAESAYSAGWYSCQLLISNIREIIFERKKISNVLVDLHDRCFLENEIEVFFDPIQIKVVIDELVLNSIKHGKTNGNFSIEISLFEKKTLRILYADNGQMVSEQIFNKIGTKGASTSGSGFGLYGVTSKVRDWGGTVQFANSVSGLMVSITLMSK